MMKKSAMKKCDACPAGGKPVSGIKKSTVLGQETRMLKTRCVEAGVTTAGGHLWPAKFLVGGRWVAPLSAAPWSAEPLARSTPEILRLLRGDFFCLPFGGNAAEHGGERHPVHGETANRRWTCEASDNPAAMHFSLKTRARGGRVDKWISLVEGHPAIYQRHVISGMSGRMPLGYHAMLHLPAQGSARISTSRFVRGQVFPGAFENPAQGGYSCLKPGAKFSSLKNVPRSDGGRADLSVYPSREGFEDLVMLVSDDAPAFAWTAAVVAEEGWIWFSLKDPRVLRSTIFWMSNGGRHYAPWNSRHRRVIGLEDVTAFFHFGHAESVRPNALSRAGIPTCATLDPSRPLAVSSIMAVAPAPKGFDEVRDIRAVKNGVELVARSGKSVGVRLDPGFLTNSSPVGGSGGIK
ncbi:MAG: hypothetical protein WCS31_15445 [Verrucomicrobiae bacterium]